MSANPKISIIVPIWNAGKYLKPALESVVAQNLSDWECICVNNASTDNSASVVKRFAKKDSRFILINRPDNGGVSIGRNAGLDIARGKYVIFLDQDDLLAPDVFDMYWGLAKKYNADMIRGKSKFIQNNFVLSDADDRQTVTAQYFDNPKSDFIKTAENSKYGSWVLVWKCCFKRSAIRGIRFDTRFFAGGEDDIFMITAVNKIKNFVQSDNIVYYYRKSETSVTNKGICCNPLVMKLYQIIMPIVQKMHFKDSKNPWLKWAYDNEMKRMYYEVVWKPLRYGKGDDITSGVGIIRDLRANGFIDLARMPIGRRIAVWMFITGFKEVLRIIINLYSFFKKK